MIADVNVTLSDISHTNSIVMLVRLIGPTGQDVILMTGSGSSDPVTGVDITLDDEASTSMPHLTILTSGTYKPTDGHPDYYELNDPPHGHALSVFDGTSPTGVWKLEVSEYAPGSGSVAGGWSLNITLATVSSSPSTGKVGDSVILSGAGFTGATAVKFGGASAAAFNVDSDTKITATVPAGARTGPVEVVVPAGAITSSADFVVGHKRTISLALGGGRGTGTVASVDAFGSCAARVPVVVQHLEHHEWRTLAAVLTHANGSFKAVRLDEPGRYRAVAKKTTLSSGDVCLKHTSRTVSAK